MYMFPSNCVLFVKCDRKSRRNEGSRSTMWGYLKKNVLIYVNKYLTKSYFRGIKCVDESFFLKNIYFRFYANKNKFIPFKFILNFFLFFISLRKKFTYEKMCFCYTLNKPNKFKHYFNN